MILGLPTAAAAAADQDLCWSDENARFLRSGTKKRNERHLQEESLIVILVHTSVQTDLLAQSTLFSRKCEEGLLRKTELVRGEKRISCKVFTPLLLLLPLHALEGGGEN